MYNCEGMMKTSNSGFSFSFLARKTDKFRMKEMKQRRLKENTWGWGVEPWRTPRDREHVLL